MSLQIEAGPRRADRPGPQPAPPRRWMTLAVLCLSLLIVTLDNTILNVALPTLVRDLHATSTQLQWIVDSYVMVFAGLLLVGGSLADRLGRRRVFLTGLVAFAAGSAWAAFSGSVAVLIAARASMGIGGALIMPSTLAVITDLFRDPGERQRAIGTWAGTSGLGIALGPITGGFLLAHFWWGSVFLLNVPVAALGFGGAVALVRESKNPHARPPDVVGALLSVAGLVLVVWAIIEAPVHGWTAPRVLGSGLSGVAVLGAFVLWEHASSHPMLTLRLFRQRSFSAAIVSVGLVMFGLFGALFVLTQFLQFALGYSALQAGVRALPAAGAIAAVAPMSALAVRWAGTRLTLGLGLLTIAAGLWQLSAVTAATTYGDVVAGMVLLGVGAGLAIPSATASVMGSLPQEHAGVGSATNGTFLQVGGALGVAVVGSLLIERYQGRMTSVLAPYHLPAQVRETILGSLGGAQQVAEHTGGPTGPTLAHVARSAFVDGMGLGLAVGAAVAAAAAVVALVALPGRRRHPGRPGGPQ